MEKLRLMEVNRLTPKITQNSNPGLLGPKALVPPQV